jgi:hypothetical protein
MPAIQYLLDTKRAHGFYEPITNTLYCRSDFMCLHEQGHKLDDEHDWISKTQEFKKAFEKYSKTYNGARLKVYIDWLAKRDFYNRIYFKLNYYQEAYAEIYQIHGGNIEWMPEYLQEFYE